MAEPMRCPVCGRKPDVDECGPATLDEGHLGWHVGCYSFYPTEHYVGANGDTREDAIAAYNRDAIRTSAALANPDPPHE